MKKWKKILALSLGSMMAFSLFAGCGGGNEEEGGNPPPTPPEGGDPPITETPDAQAPAYTDAQATLTMSGNINPSNAKRVVSEDLFGLFLEDINYASFALDDNLVCNGSFEALSQGIQNGKKHAWQENGASITVESTAANRIYSTNTDYAVVNVAKANGAIVNEGYYAVPMYIKRDTDYLFSMFIKDYAGSITVSAKKDDDVFATKTFDVDASAEWVKIEQTVHSTRTSSQVNPRLEISFGTADDRVLIDSVSFETSDATVGIKNYLYEAIADLSPAFFRFPGGCVIEGTSEPTAYDWKNSIGAVKQGDDDKVLPFTYTLNKDGEVKEVTTYGEWATRTPNLNIWQPKDRYYDHEYGIGFYEYFLLCDRLGAKAIPIVNCGLSCQTQSGTVGVGNVLPGRHNNGVRDYIQDAIDLIEFAKGATTTEWGHVRELMGHPEPFEMDYIGIGNEQWDGGTKYYQTYYEEFLKSAAFQEALATYDVKPIVGNCTMFDHIEYPATSRRGFAQNAAISARSNGIISKIADYGVVDQHYYMNYTDFLAQANVYDNYARPDDKPNDYYEVFVGEYSANSDMVRSPAADDTIHYAYTENSWITALSEAAAMTGFERNGDIVKLAAYAPMFGTIERANRQWAVDMMFFDRSNVVLTPNYYVQQLFMQNSGDYKINAHISYADGVTAPKTTYTATQGIGTLASRTLDDIFYVIDQDKETGDIIIKIVNAGDTELKFNIECNISGVTLTGLGTVTELVCSDPAKVSEVRKPAVSPNTYTVGGFTEGKKVGYTVKAYSVTAIRLHTEQ